MTDATKINLSAKELDLVCNTDWILTKQVVIAKVFKIFGDAVPLMKHIIINNVNALPAAVTSSQPKISKGENYLELPYIILDYPRCFEKNDCMAVRNLFWWGNFFSSTLQLSGRYKNDAIPALINHFLFIQQNDFYICINNDQWQHHFENDNYLPADNFTLSEFSAMLTREPFIKIAKKIPLNQWDDVPEFIEKSFAELIGLLKIT